MPIEYVETGKITTQAKYQYTFWKIPTQIGLNDQTKLIECSLYSTISYAFSPKSEAYICSRLKVMRKYLGFLLAAVRARGDHK